MASAVSAVAIDTKIYKSAELPFDWTKMSRTLSGDNWDPQNNIAPIDPATHWAGQEGQDKLNAAYTDAAAWKAELEAVTKLYADHYKTGPFK